MRVVSLSGVDGSGKSTVASAIASRVRSRGATAVVLHWPTDSLLGFLPDESTPGISRAADLFGADSSASESGHRPTERAVDAEQSTVGACRSYATVLVFTLKFWLVLLNCLFMIGYLPVRYRSVDYVVLDRCVLDDLIQLEYRGVPRPLVAAGIALIGTSGIYCLEIDPPTAAARDRGSNGPDHPADYYERKGRLYRQYASQRDVARIDATSEPAVIAATVLRAAE